MELEASESKIGSVFFVHSSICVEMCLRIIAQKRLLIEDILILNSREVQGIPEEIKQIILDKEFDFFPYFTLSKLWTFEWIKTRNIVKKWDAILMQNMPNNFVFYSQNGRHYKYRVIATNENCVATNYFEDGVDFYMSNEEFNKKYPEPLPFKYKITNSVLGYLTRTYNRVFQMDSVFPAKTYDDGLLYGISKLCARKFASRLKGIVVIKDRYSSEVFQMGLNSLLICFSALEEQNISSNVNMMHGYKQFLESSQKQYTNIFCRFHPAQNEKTRNYILSSLKEIEVQILPDELIIENLVQGQCKQFDIVGCGSSVLMYSYLLNPLCHVNVIYPMIEKYQGLTARSSQWRDTFKTLESNRIKIWN